MKKEFPKNIVSRPCKICGHKANYSNPLTTCFECKNRFCYQHITSMQVTKKMKEGDSVRDICDSCIKDSEYYHL